MAEVTGDLGGQPIQLNNAATEATLKQLLAAMTVIANNTGKDKAARAKSQQELEKELKKLAAASKKAALEAEKNSEALEDNTDETEENTEATKGLTKEQKKNIDAQKKAIKAQQEYIQTLNGIKGAMSGLGSAVAGAASGMTNMLSSLANLGNSLTSTAQVFSQIPVVGGVLSGMFGAVAGAAEKTYDAFKKSASVGANFGGSMTEMMDAATGAGLTFDAFSGIIAKTGKDLALLGGDSEAGARRLGALGKQIKGTALAADLNRLGYSTEAISEGMATYAGQLAKTGSLQGMSDAQLIASTGSYLKDLDALTKLTGKNKQELEGERNARLKDAQFRLIMSKMDVESQKNLQNLMDSIPAEHQEGMKEIIATGTATSEAGKKALAFLPDSAKNMMSLNQQIRTTGKMGADQAAQLNAAYQRETQAFVKSGTAENMALYGDEASRRFFVGAADAAAKEKNLAQIQAEQQKAAGERAAKEKELKDKQLDPASMEEYKNKIAATSNEFTKFLANSGMLDTMMEAFAMLVDIVELVVMPAFEYVADNFETIAWVVGGAYAAFLALKGLIFAANVKLALQSFFLAKSAAAAGANAIATGVATGAVSKMGIVAMLTSLPFLKIIAVGTLLYMIFKSLYDAGWDLGTTFQAIGDKLYDVFVLGFKDLMTSILEFLGPRFGGISKDEAKARRESTTAERQDLKQREAARDAQRAANRVARKTSVEGDEALAAQHQQNLELEKSTKALDLNSVEGRKLAREKERELRTSEAARAAKEKELKTAKDAAAASTSTPGVNLSSPQAMFDSMVRRQQGGTAGAANQPGATTTAPVTGAATPPPINQDQTKNMEMIKAALQKQGITDPKYIAATLGNVMKESGGKSQTENLNYGNTSNDRIKSIFGDRAKGKSDAELNDIKKDPSKMGEMMYGSTTKIGKQMGNTEPGDGFKFRGRGFIQLTGKSNYSQASKAIYNDNRLVDNPDLANDPAVAAEISAWYMKKGQAGMAKSMGIDTKNMSQDQANLLATSQIAGQDVRKAGGYLGGEVMNKVTAYSGQMASIAGAPTKPMAEIEALYGPGKPAPGGVPASSQTADAARAAAAATDPRRTDRQPTVAAGARQETPESLLASLNTKMDTLIGLNRSLKDTNERQLTVQRNIAQTGDLYA